MGIVNYDEKRINSFAETIDALDRKRKGLATKVVGGKLLSKTKGDEAVAEMAEVTEKMRATVQEMWDSKSIVKVKVDNIREVPEMKELMPPMDPVDFGVFKADIQKCGVIVPIVVTTLDNLIDGHRRLQACKDLGRKEIPAVRVSMTDSKLMVQFAYKLNVLRRHLTMKQKKHLILKIKDHIVTGRGRPVKKEGKLTTVQVAKDLGVSRSTVQSVLDETGKRAQRGEIGSRDPLITAPIPKEKAGVTYETHHEEWKAKDYEADKDRPKQWIDRIVSNSSLGPKDKYQVKVTVIVSRKET